MPLMAGAVVGAGAITSYMGGKAASKQSAAALAQQREFTQKAIAALEQVGIPSVEAQKIALETPQMVFNYVPEMEKEFPELKSQFDQIQTDPRLQQAQSEALAGIQARSEQGLTSDEMAEINALRRGTAQQAAARDSSILQNLEQRGMGGSGAELMSRLAASQAAAQQASIDTENQAALIAQRKLEALQQLGNMAQTQEAQQFSQAGQKASAADTIAQLNQAARYNIQSSNVGAQRQARLNKEEIKQDLEGVRANTANTQEQYNKNLLQQDYQNRLAKAQSMANAYTGAGSQALAAGQNQAANTMAMWQGIGQAGMGGAQLYGAAQDRALTRDANALKDRELKAKGY